MIEDMASVTLLLFLVCENLLNSALCCRCDRFLRFDWKHFSNISLNGYGWFYLEAFVIDINDCSDIEAHWEIQRADGETEVYSVLNETYHYGHYLPDRGLSLEGDCHNIICFTHMKIDPTDLRHNGAQITGVLNLPECKISKITDPMTLNIQGLLDGPTDVNVDQVSVESVNVSWTPPFTLNEVPILMYTVYITSQGYTESRNTTETSTTLERPCHSTTYEISGWNEVGEGHIAIYVLTMYQALVKVVSELFESVIILCASCSFFTDSIADGCTIELQSNKYKFIFNMSHQNSRESALLECFSVPEAGVYNVSVYEILHGGTVGHKTWNLPQITISEDSTEETTAGATQKRAVTGLAVVLSLTLIGVIVVILTVIIFIIRIVTKLNNFTNRTGENRSSATSCYVNTPLSNARNDIHDQMEQRSTGAVESEGIQLSDNITYGRVQI